MPRISNFSGLISNADIGDIPGEGSQFQKNVNTNKPGLLVPRKGIQPANFEIAVNLGEGYNTFQKMCFCKTRTGEIIGVNGMDRGFIWDGFSDSLDVLGVDKPANGPTIAVSAINSLSGSTAIQAKTTTGEYQINHNSHGLSTGNKVLIGEVEGTGAIKPQLNGNKFTITVINANSFYLNDTTFTGTYSTSTGRWSLDGTGATKAMYFCAYRYKTGDSTSVFSVISTETMPEAQTCDKFAWSNITASTNSRVTKVELWRSTGDQFKTIYKVAEIDNGTTTYTDTLDDDALTAKSGDDVMDIIGSDGSPIARRQVPPPDHFAFCTMFQDRYFYFGPVKYSRGTVGTGGSATTTLTGVGTDWPTTVVGRYIEIAGTNKSIEITARGSDTSITLAESVTIANGTSYVIYPEKSARRQILFSYQDEPESVPINNSFTIQANNNDDAEIVGAMPYGSNLLIMTKRFKYSLSYGNTPLKDGSLVFLDDRGAFNHYSWDVFESIGYLMDDSGAYAFDGRESSSISAPIQDIWRKDGSVGSIDFSKSDAFFVKTDRATERVYFFVIFTGDSSTYPTRALVYNIRRESWDMMEYPVEISNGVTVEENGEPKTILGSENESFFELDAGNTDIVTTETSGTATSGTSTTLVDTSANWDSNAFQNASLYITQGAGKGQRRTILGNESQTITVSPSWTTNPDSTSKYSIGAIEWSWKSGSFGIPEADVRVPKEFSVKFKPTTNNTSFDLQLYYNGEDDAIEYQMAQDLGSAVEIMSDNKKDVVINIGKNFSPLEQSTGREKFRFDGMYSTMATGEHKVAFNIRGHSGTERPEIQLIDITGIEEQGDS